MVMKSRFFKEFGKGQGDVGELMICLGKFQELYDSWDIALVELHYFNQTDIM